MPASHGTMIALVALALLGRPAFAQEVPSQVTETAGLEASRCSCESLCSVQKRRPSEVGRMTSAEGDTVEALASVKCVPKFEAPTQCELGEGGRVIKRLETDSALTSQYCFLECRPLGVEVGDSCYPLSTQQAAAGRTEDGQGTDVRGVPVSIEPPTQAPPVPPPLPVEDGGPPDHRVSLPPPPPPPASASEETLKEASDAKNSAAATAAALANLAGAAAKHADHSEKHAAEARAVVELRQLHRARRDFFHGRALRH